MWTTTSRSAVRITVVAALALFVAACAGPNTTRTGGVHDIRVTEGPEPADLLVRVGDEVRWVNGRALPIRLDLVNVNSEDISCERGFSNLFGMHRDSATIKANETASTCFTKPGVVKYNVRMDSALPGGTKVVSGVVRIDTN